MCLDKDLILDKYSSLEAKLRWFDYSLTVYQTRNATPVTYVVEIAFHASMLHLFSSLALFCFDNCQMGIACSDQLCIFVIDRRR